MGKIILTTSLYRLWKYQACQDRYHHLVSKLGEGYGDKEPINLLAILKHNGVDDCLWALRAVDQKGKEPERTMRHMAADFAETALPIYEKEYPDDKRPRMAIQAAHDYADGKITAAAWAAARDAASAAVRAAVRAAASAAARAAAWDAARDAQIKIIKKYLSL